MPPLFIFDSKATNSDNYKLKPAWCKHLPVAKALLGNSVEKEFHSFVYVSSSGSMTDIIFQQYIEKCILDLYSNLGPKWELSPCGEKFIKGPALIKTDMGQGRLVVDRTNIEWRKAMKKKGVIMLGLAPTATVINVDLDNMFGQYKGMCLKSSQRVFNKKLHEKMLAIRRRRLDPNFIVLSKAVGLDTEDIQVITNRFPGGDITNSLFQTCFIKTYILKSWSNVGFIPFTGKCL